MSNQPPSRHNKNRNDEALCGKKFRSMLKCVEQTGAIPSCHRNIHEFLECQRSVFKAAATSRTTPPLHPPQPKDLTNPPPPNPHPLQFLRRIVQTQANACTNLLHSIVDIQPHSKIATFSKRMLADMQQSGRIIGHRAHKSFVSLWQGSSRKDPGDSSPT